MLAYGAIGDEHNRAIAATPGLRLVAVADTNPERLAAAQLLAPDVTTFTDSTAMLDSGLLELVGKEAFTSWNSPSQLRLGENIEEFDAVDPYQLMIENFGKKVQGQESWVLPLETSLFVQRALDQLRTRF